MNKISLSRLKKALRSVVGWDSKLTAASEAQLQSAIEDRLAQELDARQTGGRLVLRRWAPAATVAAFLISISLWTQYSRRDRIQTLALVPPENQWELLENLDMVEDLDVLEEWEG